MTAEEKIRFEELMRRCIELGRIAKERGDNPVGAVLALGKDFQYAGFGAKRRSLFGDILHVGANAAPRRSCDFDV